MLTGYIFTICSVNDSAEFLYAVWLIDVETNSWSAVDTYGKIPVRISCSELQN
jgi:hypothetical protein